MKKLMIPALLALMVAVFLAGAYFGGDLLDKRPSFHDLDVNLPDDFSSLIQPRDGDVTVLAGDLGTPAAAYNFVRDRIAFDPSLAVAAPGVILREGRASCLGKAVLLCSLYRAMGMPADDVRVVTGQVLYGDSAVEHAWLDLEYNGTCLQQDPTSLYGTFKFDEFNGTRYTQIYVHREHLCFNDTGLAIVSPLNRFRGTDHPALRGQSSAAGNRPQE